MPIRPENRHYYQGNTYDAPMRAAGLRERRAQ